MFCALHGTTRERALGRAAHHFLTPESSRVALAAIARNSTEPYEVTAVREDGSTFPLEATGHTIWYQGRRMRVATLRDLSERKTAEEALLRSEARNRSLIQAACTGERRAGRRSAISRRGAASDLACWSAASPRNSAAR